MPKANKERGGGYAKIEREWFRLKAWRDMSTNARALLVEIIGSYRPGTNGMLAWSVRDAALVLNSKSTAARALVELENFGWITIESVGSFKKKNKPSLYALTMYANDATHEAASMAFQYMGHVSQPVPKKQLSQERPVPPAGLHSPSHGTPQSHPWDSKHYRNEPIQISEALRNSRNFRGL